MANLRSFKPAEQKNDYTEVWKRILESKTEFSFTHATNDPKKMTISAFIEEKSKEGKKVVFTATPGPFPAFKTDLSPQDQAEWKGDKAYEAMGCTAQLQGLNKGVAKRADVVVVAFNIQSSDKQHDILSDKERKLENLYMGCDSNLELPKLGWPKIQVGNTTYLGRLTVVQKGADFQIFDVKRGQDGVNEVCAIKHATEVMNAFDLKPTVASTLGASA